MTRAAHSLSRVHRLVLGILSALLVTLAAPAVRAETLPVATDLRFGEHEKWTRVVIDFDRQVAFTARAEVDPSRLELDLGPVDWRLGPDSGKPLRGMVRAYELGAGSDGGARLTVALSRPARVVSAFVLAPNRDNTNYRVVVDLAALRPGDLAPAAAPPVAAAAPTDAGAPAEADRPDLPRPDAPVPSSRPVEFAALPATATHLDGTAGPTYGGRELPVIVLDPGHGGVDPGATSVDGRYEKDLVLDMARELERRIERSGRYRVVLTRDGDEFIALRDRIAKARHLGGDAFISLHADSLRLADTRGASIYTLSEQASDAEAAKFAAQENKADILTGADLSQHDAVVATILIDLAQRDTNNKSIALADAMAEELARVTSLVKRHRRFAGFAVLKSPDVPSVLLELGYLSNPDDARNLAQRNYRAKLGQAIVRSLDRYFAVPRS